mmetsp:Transcript_35413/g.89428  ORF Transcript_35413/g.89428 Transcript_35413/m.89428 type:complete len:362 (+) Transcript_35413:259-1344(+)
MSADDSRAALPPVPCRKQAPESPSGSEAFNEALGFLNKPSTPISSDWSGAGSPMASPFRTAGGMSPAFDSPSSNSGDSAGMFFRDGADARSGTATPETPLSPGHDAGGDAWSAVEAEEGAATGAKEGAASRQPDPASRTKLAPIAEEDAQPAVNAGAQATQQPLDAAYGGRAQLRFGGGLGSEPHPSGDLKNLESRFEAVMQSSGVSSGLDMLEKCSRMTTEIEAMKEYRKRVERSAAADRKDKELAEALLEATKAKLNAQIFQTKLEQGRRQLKQERLQHEMARKDLEAKLEAGVKRQSSPSAEEGELKKKRLKVGDAVKEGERLGDRKTNGAHVAASARREGGGDGTHVRAPRRWWPRR